METKRINLIPGPRNISTALMYSFANRPDTVVVDEPMYAYYLSTSGADHPGRNQILEALPSELDRVLSDIIFAEIDAPVYFIKGMAHHYFRADLNFILDLENVFLIREPAKLISSFSKIIENPTMQDIGVRKEWEIFRWLRERGRDPIVLDSGVVLSNPEKVLKEFCHRLGISFTENMLSWPIGPIASDGVWAKYWYGNVHQSSGFLKKSEKAPVLPESLRPLCEEADELYSYLFEFAIKA